MAEDRWAEYVIGVEKAGSFKPPKIEKPVKSGKAAKATKSPAPRRKR